MTKRVVDTLGAFFGLVVCMPLFVLIAFLIKVNSRGPVLFRQVRVGRGFR
ncbi:MAG: sugar transferase, partial [Nitrospirota bacterium]